MWEMKPGKTVETSLGGSREPCKGGDPGELQKASEQRRDRVRALAALWRGMGSFPPPMGWRPAWGPGAQQGAGCGHLGINEPPGLDMPATEKRRKSRFGVSAEVLGICGLSLGGSREVWVG